MELKSDSIETETLRARQSRFDYCNLGPNRSISKLLTQYQSDPKTAPTLVLARLKIWSRRWGWVDESRRHDEAHAIALVEDLNRDRRAEYRREMADFVRIHSGLGKNSITMVVKLSKQLAQWCESQADTPIHPDDVGKALAISKLISQIQPLTECWARSIGVERIWRHLEEVEFDEG